MFLTLDVILVETDYSGLMVVMGDLETDYSGQMVLMGDPQQLVVKDSALIPVSNQERLTTTVMFHGLFYVKLWMVIDDLL